MPWREIAGIYAKTGVDWQRRVRWQKFEGIDKQTRQNAERRGIRTVEMRNLHVIFVTLSLPESIFSYLL